MVDQTKAIFVSLREKIYAALEADVVNTLSREQLTEQLSEAIDVLIDREQHSVATVVRREYVKSLVDEIVGLGPLQPLMDDESISDIMINGHDNVFIERNGLVEKSSVTFIDETQLQQIAKRIAARVGRRVDDSAPTCDARLADGSRVNIVIPPIAIDGTSVSIRKFKKQSIGLEELVGYGAMSQRWPKY